MEKNLELHYFPDGLAGHPLCIAYLIMKVYPDFEVAVERPNGANYCRALLDQRIPGGASDVWAAIDCLKRGQYLGTTAALEYADEYWRQRTEVNAMLHERGNAQARTIATLFAEGLPNWGRVTA